MQVNSRSTVAPVVTAIFLSAVSVLLSACNTTEGAGKDIQNTGAAISKSADQNKPQ